MLLSLLIEMTLRQSYTRDQILAVQEKQFRKLLFFVWNHSSFYREFFQSYGIQEKHLGEIKVTDLPFTSKELLMEHFDHAVTDKALKKNILQAWIENEQDPKKLYKNKYVVVNTSGTTGNVGIFIYDPKSWDTIRASLITRVSQPKFNPLHKRKVAFYGATNGRFGGISLVRNIPKL